MIRAVDVRPVGGKEKLIYCLLHHIISDQILFMSMIEDHCQILNDFIFKCEK
jgi:hypothetical protein